MRFRGLLADEDERAKRRGNPVVLPSDFLVVPSHLFHRSIERSPEDIGPVRAVPVIIHRRDDSFPEETKEAFPSPTCFSEEIEEEESPSNLPLSTEEKVLAVHQGALFRARLKRSRTSGSRASGLGITVKCTADGRIVVHALPRPDPEIWGLAEAAGIKVGDQVLGVGATYFPQKSTLATLVARVKEEPPENDIILILKRGLGKKKKQKINNHSLINEQDTSPNKLCHMAKILQDQGVVDQVQAAVLSTMMAQLERRLARWDKSGDLLAGSPMSLSFRGYSDSSSSTKHAKIKQNFRRTISSESDISRDDFHDESMSGILSDDESHINEKQHSPNYESWGKSLGSVHTFSSSGSFSQQTTYFATTPTTHILNTSTSVEAASTPRPTVIANAKKEALLRPALCVRILGTDYVEDHTVYILWVLDVLAGAEWRVQRRFREFFELHEELIKLRPSIDKLDFPTRRPSIYETVHTVNDRRVRLERYIRRVAGMLTSSRLHPRSSDVARVLQRFLDVPKRRASLELLERNPDITLRQACQVATAQVLSLPVLDKLLSDVVSSTQSHDFESGDAMLQKMKQYIDHLQAAILDGSHDLLKSVALRRVPSNALPIDELNTTLSAAVRRQIETDIYVPLMEKVHDLLSTDIESEEFALQRKCIRARSRPQTFYGIPIQHISPSSWESAIYQLANIGAYTLPCDKLDALLAAAKEIPALYRVEHPGTDTHLGADDFLPIFIYVLVNAKVPDLLHLQHVLCTLCDPDKRLSETGYYLSSFEAAVSYIRHDLDLD